MATYVDAIFHSIELTGTEFKLSDAVPKAYVDFTVTSAINAVVDGAVPALDTLREIGQQLYAGSTVSTAITNSLTVVRTDLATEIANRAASDATQNVGIANELARALAAEALLSGRITSSADASTYGFTDLDTRLRNEILARVNTDNNLDGLVTQERDMRIETDNGLQNQVDTLRVDKLEASSQYQKRLVDGALQVTYLYISDVWRLGASTGASSKRLQFEFFDGTVWGVCVPFVRPV